MKLILKNLRQAEFEIEVESNLITVKELKLKIESEYSFDSDQIKLIYKGAILDDSKSLIQYNIEENCTIVMMSTKKKQMENKPETNNSNINIYNNINKPIEQNIPKEEKTNTKEEITDILKDNLNITINSLVDMGYEKSQAEIAVKAANGRIDLAVEYLNNGIPDNIKNNNSRNNSNNNKNEIMNELKKQASIIKVLCKNDKNYIFYLLDNIKRYDPGLLRLITDYRNEFEKFLDEPITEEDERIYKNIETKADEIISKKFNKTLKELGDKLKEKNEKKEKEKKEDDKNYNEEKDKIKEDKDKEEKDKNDDNKKDNIEEKKEKEKENKDDKKKEEKNKKTEDKKDEMENNEEKKPEENKEKTQLEENEHKKNSEEMKKEKENENEQKNDKVENNEENNNKEIENKNIDNNNQNENQLTEHDKEVITRLQNLGDFSYDKVYEAYIVCNKNEELTANYLFETYN